ncbi:hypothetical protein JTB14_022841 [Gonioctena quinquepunctata]|nr:hypothetical protein JTB14_022841 [Gonioctena quinquepunctata]
MNLEENRLQTFNNWPSDAAVNPQRIAKAGFFSTNQGLEVECFACHLKISEWDYGDRVMARHIALSPDCPFVSNPSTSGNVPIISTHVPSTSVNLYRDSLAMRLASFENWPVSNIVSPERLARAGFYYLKEADNTKCAVCKGVVRAWEPGDDPDAEHQRHFPNCPFVISVINPRLQVTNNGDGANNSIGKDSFPNVTLVGEEQNLDELGVQAHKGPKRLNFATVESRLHSFINWSADLIQTPEVLSQAGFYYEGLGDQVRCFHCDGGLRHWDPHDDPWTEHARWFPNCSFVKLVKGQEFVTACTNNQESHRPSTRKTPATRIRREVTERELQAHLNSPQAMTALSIGLNLERVKRAIKEKLEQTGRAYSQPDALVEAALNLQHEEEDPSADSDSSTNINFRQAVYTLLSEAEKQRRQHQEPSRQNAESSRVYPEPSFLNPEPSPLNPEPSLLNPESSRQNPESPHQNPDASLQNVSTSPGSVENCSADNTNKSSDKYVSLEDENRIIKEARLCKICMNGEMGIVFLPCGHLATCVDCAFYLEDCPVCRSSIKATVRAFFS